VIVPLEVVASTEIARETFMQLIPVGDIVKLDRVGAITSDIVAVQPVLVPDPSDLYWKVRVPSEAEDTIVPGLVVP
jgi:hypothetical protein